MQATRVKKFLLGALWELEILARSAAFAPASSSGACFFFATFLPKEKWRTGFCVPPAGGTKGETYQKRHPFRDVFF